MNLKILLAISIVLIIAGVINMAASLVFDTGILYKYANGNRVMDFLLGFGSFIIGLLLYIIP